MITDCWCLCLVEEPLAYNIAYIEGDNHLVADELPRTSAAAGALHDELIAVPGWSHLDIDTTEFLDVGVDERCANGEGDLMSKTQKTIKLASVVQAPWEQGCTHPVEF